MRKEPPDRPRLRSSARRRARWLGIQATRAVSLSREQIELIRKGWGQQAPDESDEDRDKDARSIRRNRAGTVPEEATKWVVLALILLLLLIWWTYQLATRGLHELPAGPGRARPSACRRPVRPGPGARQPSKGDRGPPTGGGPTCVVPTVTCQNQGRVRT